MRVFALLLALLLIPSAAEARKMENAGVAVLRTIDKLSARTSTFEVPVDKTVKFADRLFIKVRACRKAAALDAPESAAFLQIWEKKPGAEESNWVFSGWMFASKPSVSAIEHPVYDVWVIECKDAAGKDKAVKAESDFASEDAPDDASAADAPEKKVEEKSTEEKPAAVKPTGDSKPALEEDTHATD